MNGLITTEPKTPIEIALGVDGEERVSARNLYDFLELAKSQFSRWAKTNIEGNELYEENIDWWGFDIVSNGNETKEYKLTIDFAKHLAMSSQSPKGKEARNYFIKVEDKLKQVAIQVSQLSPQLQLFNQMFQTIANNELVLKRTEQLALEASKQSEQNSQKINSIKDTMAELPKDQWRKWVNSSLSDMVIHNRNLNHEAIRSDSYKLLEERAGADLSARVRNGRKRLEDKAATKTTIDNYRKLDAIEEDKRLKEIYTAIIKEMRIKYLV